MDLLTFSQTLFYFVSSIVIIVVGVLLTMAIYHVLNIVKSADALSKKIGAASDEIKNLAIYLIEKIASIPVISSFFSEKSKSAKENKEHGKKVKNK